MVLDKRRIILIKMLLENGEYDISAETAQSFRVRI